MNGRALRRLLLMDGAKMGRKAIQVGGVLGYYGWGVFN